MTGETPTVIRGDVVAENETMIPGIAAPEIIEGEVEDPPQ